MVVGTPGRGKHDTLAELAVVLARLFGRGGNRVGALFYDTGVLCTVPPGTGRRHVLRIAAELDRTTGIRRGDTTDLAAMLDAAGRLARRRSLIIVISDFIGDGDWERSLLRLSRRHEVVALRIADGADDDLPEAGLIVVEDAETGEQLTVDSSDAEFRHRLREAGEHREAELRAATLRAGVDIYEVSTGDDLVPALVRMVESRKRRSR